MEIKKERRRGTAYVWWLLERFHSRERNSESIMTLDDKDTLVFAAAAYGQFDTYHYRTGRSIVLMQDHPQDPTGEKLTFSVNGTQQLLIQIQCPIVFIVIINRRSSTEHVAVCDVVACGEARMRPCFFLAWLIAEWIFPESRQPSLADTGNGYFQDIELTIGDGNRERF